MTSEEYKWTINLVKERYHLLKLSFQQAEKVYEFEKEKDFSSPKYFLSAWEEYDYMFDTFHKFSMKSSLRNFSCGIMKTLKNINSILSKETKSN
jgi:hypothetical protein